MQFKHLRDQLISDFRADYRDKPMSPDVARGVAGALNLCGRATSVEHFEKLMLADLRQQSLSAPDFSEPMPIETETRFLHLSLLYNCFNFLSGRKDDALDETKEFATRSLLRCIARNKPETP